MSELKISGVKACPLCGNQPRSFAHGVECPNCGLVLKRINADALEAWNKRTELDRIAGPLVEALAHLGVTEEALQNTSFESMIDGTDCSNLLYHALANYRKERGK